MRKEPKKHGRQKQIEGISGPIRKVVIVDEVCTTGKSTQEAIDAAEAEGYEVVAVISLVDREEGGSEKLRSRYKYRAIFTARELMDRISPRANRPQTPQLPHTHSASHPPDFRQPCSPNRGSLG